MSTLSIPRALLRRKRVCQCLGCAVLLGAVATTGVASESGATLTPRASDIIFSPRLLSPEAPQAAQDWGATRIEWVYALTPAAEGVLKRLPQGVGQTLSAKPKLPRGEGYALDFDGQPIIAPWMKAWGAKWVTTTHPETRQVIAEQVDHFLAAGARSIQVDDPQLQMYAALRQAGDFNPATQAGFKDWLRLKADPAAVKVAGLTDFDGDYRDFLVHRHQVRNAEDYQRRFQTFPSTPLWLAYIQSTVADHYSALRQRLHAARPPVALSMNLTDLVWPDTRSPNFFLTEYADYVLAETRIADTSELVARAATARAFHLGLVPSLQPLDVARNRVAIATLYALGAQPLIPWDVFVAADKPRYSGSVGEYGDLYSLVRKNAELLDGHEAVAPVGIVVDPQSFPRDAVSAFVRRLAERQITYDFVLVGPEASGRRAPTANALRKLKLLVMAMPDAELSAAESKLLRSVAVPRLPLDRVPTEQLDALRPVIVAPGGESLRVYVRVKVPAETDWVLHVVDERKGQPAAAVEGACHRRVALRSPVFPQRLPAAASWVTPNGAVTVRAEPAGDATYYTLPGCPLWGVLHVAPWSSK